MRYFFVSLTLVALSSFWALGMPQSASPAAPAVQRETAGGFDDLARLAAEAKENGAAAEAIGHYRAALELNPEWLEGWYSLGVLLHDTDAYPEAVAAFRELTRRRPDRPEGWALQGLSEYSARQYDAALTDLTRALSMNMTRNSSLTGLVRVHVGSLLNRAGRFDEALLILTEQARMDDHPVRLEQAFGIAMLRLPYLSEEVPDDRKELVRMAGRASVLLARDKRDLALVAFEELLKKYPDTPEIHYAFGSFLARDDVPRAIGELQRELELSPDHVRALLRLSHILWMEGRNDEARGYAEKAVALSPETPAPHIMLGRVLLSQEELLLAIANLEVAVTLEPRDTEALMTLHRAYSRAGRTEDAEQVQQAILRLQQSSAPSPGSARSP